MKLITLLLTVFVLSGCQNLPKTNYKEVASLSNQTRVHNEISVCRDGAFADKAILRLYFDDEYVANIPQSVYSKSRFRVVYDEKVKTISVRHSDGKIVSSLSVTQKTPKKIFIAIVSETSSFIPIPLPGFVYTKMKGSRKIEAVSESTFNEMCGEVTEVILTK